MLDRSARRSTNIAPTLPGPDHARRVSGKQRSLNQGAVLAKLVMTEAMVMMVATMPGAGGRLADGRGHGGGHGNQSNGGDDELVRGGHWSSFVSREREPLSSPQGCDEPARTDTSGRALHRDLLVSTGCSRR